MSVIPTFVPKELIVLAVAAMPITEVRAAIPLAILGFGFSAPAALFWSLLGNAVPIPLVYLFGRSWLRFVERRRGFLHHVTDRMLRRTHGAFNDRFGSWGLIALTVFVAVPLPLTGAWTGALAAFIFGIPFRKAFPLIMLGNLIAGVIVVLAVSGGVAAFRVFL